MDRLVLEKYLCDGSLDSEELKEIDWQNNIMTLGLVLGISDKGKVKNEVYMSIARNPRLNPAFRVCSFMRLLEEIKEDIPKTNEMNKMQAGSLISKFIEISDQIFSLKNDITTMKELIKNIYTKTFSDLMTKFCLNSKIVLLAVSGLKNRDVLATECSLFHFSIEELEKLAQYALSDKYKILQILRKGCEIIESQKYRGNEPISIIVFNTLYDSLRFFNFEPEDAIHIETSLMKYQDNFTPKQKTKLLEIYIEICTKLGSKTNDQLLDDYYKKGAAPKSNKRNEAIQEPYIKKSNEAKIDNHSRYQNEIKINNPPKNIEKENKKNYYQRPETHDREITFSLVDNLLAWLKSEIRANKRVELSDLIEKLKESTQISEDLMFERLYELSYNEKSSRDNSLAWKLISKAVSHGNILANDKRRNLNMQIDVITRSNKRYY
ncbi:hypothetical protein SteCoe_23672 [Stentor coeruleus]|uniref:Uncharacterized protein n=1 Tax=Stentor coeruleus TaxID=5963 RepID=A0A1R2BJS8_9CILI|nr:hypothetical protein SteCoe_23672 [Stentor coeruleus]